MYFIVIAAIIIATVRESYNLPKTIEALIPFNPLWTTLATIGLSAVTILTCELLARVTLRKLQSTVEDKRLCIASYRRGLLAYSVLILFVFFVQIHLLQWPRVVTETLRLNQIILIDDVLVIAPFVISLVLSWVILYRIDRVLSLGKRRYLSGFCNDGNSISDSGGLREYLDFNVRQYLALFLLLWLIFQGSLDIFKLLVGPHQDYPNAYALTEIALAFVIYSLAPYAIKYVWRTTPLPHGELRQRLERLCKMTGLRCRDILIWKTGENRITNAAITGLFGKVRYILITDALFKYMRYDEIEAVFGHEIGHVKHKHIPLYLMFSLGFILLLSILTDLLPSSVGEEFLEGIPILLLSATLYLLMFGFLSRRLERQADVYGAKIVGDVNLFVRALERISLLNGIARDKPSWRHPSIAKRVDFLFRMRDDPQVEQKFQKSLRRAILICVIIFCAAAAKVGTDYLSTNLATSSQIENSNIGKN